MALPSPVLRCEAAPHRDFVPQVMKLTKLATSVYYRSHNG
jgi:hypothetical protein